MAIVEFVMSDALMSFGKFRKYAPWAMALNLSYENSKSIYSQCAFIIKFLEAKQNSKWNLLQNSRCQVEPPWNKVPRIELEKLRALKRIMQIAANYENEH